MSAILPNYSQRVYDKACSALEQVIELAQQDMTMNYKGVMDNIDCNRRFIGSTLYVIDALCRRLHLPRINLLVVRKDTGLPSDDCQIYYGDYDNFRETVSLTDWSKHADRLRNELQVMHQQRFDA